MRTRYRLVAVDIDGTLMDSANRLPEANRAALHRAHEAGVKVCLCTGRSLTEAQHVLDALSLDLDAGTFIFGAVVSDLRQRRTLVRSPLSSALLARLTAFFAEAGYPILCVYDHTETGYDYVLLEGRRNRAAYESWVLQTPCRVVRQRHPEPDSALPLRVGVILEPGTETQTLATLQAEFSADQTKSNVIYVAQYGFHVVECFSPEVNKWYGIERLIRLWGIEPGEVAAIGDDVNDIEMLEQAAMGVAMGNASDPVKTVADLVAPGHDACGVAWAINKLLGADTPGNGT